MTGNESSHDDQNARVARTEVHVRPTPPETVVDAP